MSLLSVYDFVNASLDPNCVATLKEDCQNYNYLAAEYNYWLANGSLERNNKVYQSLTPGYIVTKFADTESALRLVIHLKKEINIDKGTGTEKDPYVVR